MAMDVGEEVRQGNVIENFQNLETLINEGLRIALLAPTPDQSIEVMLEYLGKTLHGDRTYIFEKDERGYDNNTYEWVADGVVPEKEELQNIPPEVCAHWYKKYVTDDRIFFRIINETKKSCAQITGNQFP